MDYLKKQKAKLRKSALSRVGVPLPNPPHEPTKDTSKPDRPISIEPSRYGPAPVQQPMTSRSEHSYGADQKQDDEEGTNPIRESHWRVPLRSFENYLASVQQNPSGFAEQLKELESVGKSQSTYAGKESFNAPKNAFKNIIPYDESRVKLPLDDSCSDYINASHIEGCDSSTGYIASQFPLRSSVNDWWKMIWEKNVIRIVFMESPTGVSRRKNLNIWPEEQSDFCEYGNIKVQWAQWTNHEFFSTRKIFIQKKKYRRPIMIYEYHSDTAAYPLQSVTSLVTFHQFVYGEMKEDKLNPPLLVCCKLGTGKTGTFICLDRVFKSLQNINVVEIYHTLKSMRQQRMQLVKTAEEYQLIHLCLLSLINKGAIPNKEL